MALTNSSSRKRCPGGQVGGHPRPPALPPAARATRVHAGFPYPSCAAGAAPARRQGSLLAFGAPDGRGCADGAGALCHRTRRAHPDHRPVSRSRVPLARQTWPRDSELAYLLRSLIKLSAPPPPLLLRQGTCVPLCVVLLQVTMRELLLLLRSTPATPDGVCAFLFRSFL